MLDSVIIAEKQNTQLFPLQQESHVRCDQCAIRNLSLCRAVQSLEIRKYMALGTTFSVSAKHNLFTQGEAASHIYIITQGIARLYKMLPDGRRQIVGFALPGDILGINQGESFSVSADAITNLTACCFSKQRYFEFIMDKPHILQELLTLTKNELSLAQEQIVLLGQRSAEERVAAFILGLRNRMKRSQHLSVTIPLMMSRQDIADYLGLTTETISRTLSKLMKSRLILIVPDGVRILNLQRLYELVAG